MSEQKEVDRPKCDTCGKPATHAARDAYKSLFSPYSPDPNPYIKTFSPGPWKHGCDEHKVESYLE